MGTDTNDAVRTRHITQNLKTQKPDA